MSKTKLFTGILLVLAVLFSQVGTVFAATAAQATTPLTGTIQYIVIENDGTIRVTLSVEGKTQVIRMSLADAEALGLVALNLTTNEYEAVTTMIGQTLVVDPATTAITTVEINPITLLLSEFFVVDPGAVQGYHEDGYGFGVIAQALWIARGLNDDSTTAGLILEAKKTGDYSAFTLPDGTTPKNWGQFKKAVLDKKNNLGVIVSGHADNGDPDDELIQQNKGNGKGKDNNPGKGKEKDKKQ